MRSREEDTYYKLQSLVGKLVTVNATDFVSVRGILAEVGNKFVVSFFHVEGDETYAVTVRFDEDDVTKIDNAFILVY